MIFKHLECFTWRAFCVDVWTLSVYRSAGRSSGVCPAMAMGPLRSLCPQERDMAVLLVTRGWDEWVPREVQTPQGSVGRKAFVSILDLVKG